MIFRKWGGQRPFGTFPKIHLFWRVSASLIGSPDMSPSWAEMDGKSVRTVFILETVREVAWFGGTGLEEKKQECHRDGTDAQRREHRASQSMDTGDWVSQWNGQIYQVIKLNDEIYEMNAKSCDYALYLQWLLIAKYDSMIFFVNDLWIQLLGGL